MACGNGGSAAQADHFVAELIGSGYSAISLNTPAVLTALANDDCFENVFSRQVLALGDKGDILIGMSTSGTSENILRALRAARWLEMGTVFLMGRARRYTFVDISIPFAGNTQGIQEQHLAALHRIWRAL